MTADWGELMRMNLIDEREAENYNNCNVIISGLKAQKAVRACTRIVHIHLTSTAKIKYLRQCGGYLIFVVPDISAGHNYYENIKKP